MKRTVLAVLIVAFGCDQDARKASPPAKQAHPGHPKPVDPPSGTPTTAAPSIPELATVQTQLISAGRMTAQIPVSWDSEPQETLDQLEAAAVDGPGDRQAKVAMYGATAEPLSNVHIIEATLRDPSTYWGWTLRDAAAAYVETFLQGGWSSVKTKTSDRAIDVIAIGPDRKSQLRISASKGGVTRQHSCTCLGPACKSEVKCLPPAPSADALGIDAPITDDREPVVVELRKGKLKVQAPPDYTEVERTGPPDKNSVDKVSYGAPAGRVGVVSLDYSECKLGPSCSRKEFENATATLTGIETFSGKHEGVEFTRVEYGSNDQRRRHVVWEAGGKLRMASCDCGGEACPLAMRTCELWPDARLGTDTGAK